MKHFLIIRSFLASLLFFVLVSFPPFLTRCRPSASKRHPWPGAQQMDADASELCHLGQCINRSENLRRAAVFLCCETLRRPAVAAPPVSEVALDLERTWAPLPRPPPTHPHTHTLAACRLVAEASLRAGHKALLMRRRGRRCYVFHFIYLFHFSWNIFWGLTFYFYTFYVFFIFLLASRSLAAARAVESVCCSPAAEMLRLPEELAVRECLHTRYSRRRHRYRLLLTDSCYYAHPI